MRRLLIFDIHCLASMYVFSQFSNRNAELPSTDGLKLK
ncbi:hypothetical protein T06_14370 [Trichinella sp. T6]|nr:hypothetical protein T06_14370 [Trichinella sp. T6]